tara:strand:+ start:325 stop:726 length:402 start_codon:yes stop_codon:yes gene_type:complete
MASELRVNTLKDASGNNSVGMSYVAEGTAKAWLTFNGTSTAALIDSFNISGITDNGTGDFSFAYSNNFSTANSYVAGGMVAPSSNSVTTYTLRPYSSASLATSSIRFSMVYNTGSEGVSDYPYGASTMVGDLA